MRQMILLTGATGLVGSALLRRLLAAGEEVRCLVRDPRRLGPNRVRVQITLGDLASPTSIRQAMRGVTTVVHLGASIRDQPAASIEELNGLATIRLLREAERAAAERFVFFSALGAEPDARRTRFFRAKALAERAVLDADIETAVLAPSIVYAPGDPWHDPAAAADVPAVDADRGQRAGALPADLGRGRRRLRRAVVLERTRRTASAAARAGRPGRAHLRGHRRARAGGVGARRPLVHVPLGVVRRGLRALERCRASRPSPPGRRPS